MSQILNDLVSLLTMEQIEQGIYRGQSQDIGLGHVFGGQVMGQALSAAQQTVADDRKVHSSHSYFLRAGDEKLPIIYDVENMRDGGSFSARRVKAIQKGLPIFYMSCSFQSTEDGFEHYSEMPKVAGPEGLLSHQELALKLKNKLPPSLLDKFTQETPVEMRVVNPIDPISPQACEPVRHIWIRANGNLPIEDSLHNYLLAYTSDFNFLVTAAQPHGVSFLTPGIKMATIDHSIWYHRPINMNDWLLYSVDSPNASGGRGYVKGQFFNQKGELVASTSQEGLIRLKGDKA